MNWARTYESATHFVARIPANRSCDTVWLMHSSGSSFDRRSSKFGRRGYADSLNEMVDSLLILIAPLTAVDFKKRVIVAADYAVNGITKFGWDAVGILRLDTS